MSDQYLGEIRMFASNVIPYGWAACDGAILPIAGNTALFSIIGSDYGGNGQTTFALPNLNGRAAVGFGAGPGLSEYYLGESGGVTDVTLSLDQMPQHGHLPMANLSGSMGPAEGTVWGNPSEGRPPAPFFVANPAKPLVQMNKGAFGPAGGGMPHNNLMPYTAVSFCIALLGEFPPRS
jgi:microcystin-dependent protein